MTYEVYQGVESFVFMPYSYTTESIKDFPKTWRDHYEKVYEGEIEGYEDDSDALELIFCKLNTRHPEGYKARSLSVSDVVVINGRPYYCDIFGWKEIK